MAVIGVLSGCSSYPTWIPSSGPSGEQVQSAAAASDYGMQIVDVDSEVTRRLLANQKQRLFSETLRDAAHSNDRIGVGDVVEASIWEAPPAMLFGGSGTSSSDTRTALSTARVTTFPEQMVNADGVINIPFAGQIAASGRTSREIEQEIIRRLKNKANQPQVLVRVIRNNSENVTVVGEVVTSTRMPLTARGERLLDALAAAGGVRQPVNKMTLQITRGNQVEALPLDMVIRDPKQNVFLQPGDVITSLYQPLSFTVLGATGKNEELNFEAQGISLAQALGRAGGLQDARADAQGVFIFRLESPRALDLRGEKVATTPDGKIPVIYRLDLKNPSTFFVSQSFPIQDKDVLYVSNAPAAELQKFLNIVVSVVYPTISLSNVIR
jgi:polysaccharide biosynthesis/export protein